MVLLDALKPLRLRLRLLLCVVDALEPDSEVEVEFVAFDVAVVVPIIIIIKRKQINGCKNKTPPLSHLDDGSNMRDMTHRYNSIFGEHKNQREGSGNCSMHQIKTGGGKTEGAHWCQKIGKGDRVHYNLKLMEA
jgi:hypothetical protein